MPHKQLKVSTAVVIIDRLRSEMLCTTMRRRIHARLGHLELSALERPPSKSTFANADSSMPKRDHTHQIVLRAQRQLALFENIDVETIRADFGAPVLASRLWNRRCAGQ